MIHGWHCYTEFPPYNSVFVPWIRTILNTLAFIVLRMISDVKHAILPDDLPISVSLDKGYLMDDYRVSRDSTNHHVLIMIKLEEEYKCCFYTESKKTELFRSLFSCSQEHKLPVLKHDSMCHNV